jgi:putative FmdB family regulatory protein
MPIYEYECQACGYRHEALQKISDAPLTECPSCHKNELKKLVSAAGFRLSGSGWYETDFKSSNKKNLSQKDSDKSSKDTGKSKSEAAAKKSDTKKSANSASS